MLFVALAAAPQTQATPTPPIIRIGVSTAGVGNPPRTPGGWSAVAQEHRYVEDEFAKEGVKVEWIFFKAQGPAVNEALSNNQLDFTTLGDLPSIIGRSVGLDTRIVLVAGRRGNAYIAVRPDSGIKTVADLRGKRLALNKGTASQLAANRIFATFGLAEKDVRIINMDPATAKAALLSGDVDAFINSFDLLRLQEEGKVRVIYNTKDFPIATYQAHLLVNQKFAQAYPEATTRVVKAMVRAAHWSSEPQNRDAVFKMWGDAGGIREVDYRKEYEGIPFAERLSPQIDPFIIAIDKQSVADAYKFKLIRKPFDVDAWIDRRYLDAALKELKLENYWPRFDAQGKLLAKS
ncbi:aliphatic sulfonate ABC transporter substrate-binding protein [Andreprevotia chitinilytica]|uniref:aliphatic sulfonate ABC transporter substrate-binding protein n=1 Tax=Andreprevotia chitinilytica TaxID=396808 RepID=UPI00069043EC|nr:aliphatic sulfonate ABC transporter substrate-binding protein [Andreprevotia chitinilytica]